MDSEKQTNTKSEYFKKWLMNNPDKMKKCRDNWYNANKDDEEFKMKKKEYNREYYKNKKKIKNYVPPSSIVK